jgi:hypothetical protein
MKARVQTKLSKQSSCSKPPKAVVQDLCIAIAIQDEVLLLCVRWKQAEPKQITYSFLQWFEDCQY